MREQLKQQKLQDGRCERLETNRKNVILDLFCRDHGVDAAQAADDEMLTMSDQFTEAIADKQFKDELSRRAKRPRTSTTRRDKPLEGRLPRLIQQAALKMMLVQTFGEVPTSPKGLDIQHVVDQYDKQPKEALARLSDGWKVCQHNPRAQKRLKKHLQNKKLRGMFEVYCEHKTAVEHCDEQTLLFLACQLSQRTN